jgi:glutamine amidotransferase
MVDAIASINQLHEEAGITEVRHDFITSYLWALHWFQPSLMNFCVTDGESVVATRYISSREDAAASLVRYHVLWVVRD